MKREIYLLNNLGGKHSLVMKCDKIMYDRKKKVCQIILQNM